MQGHALDAGGFKTVQRVVDERLAAHLREGFGIF